jgi:polyisoprenoid-binding protein YceI
MVAMYTMKNTLITLLMLVASYAANAQLYSTQNGIISFFSTTPVENIQAKSNRVLGVLNAEKNTVAFKVTNTSFEFPNKLMEEHFNEKYMESDKYEHSTFTGTIQDKIDYSSDGTYDVTVDGKLNIHGVEQDRSLKGKIIIKSGTIQIIANFLVVLNDHKIKVPKIVVAKIAEEIDVKIDATLLPKS